MTGRKKGPLTASEHRNVLELMDVQMMTATAADVRRAINQAAAHHPERGPLKSDMIRRAKENLLKYEKSLLI